ncbi:MAG: hypothetical protein HQK55_01600 [Deltaproteobacteria bacterium]|nr:hypothetical protein [Deltaproteobacteria bacterium]
MKLAKLLAVVLVLFFANSAFAGTIQIPEKGPVVSVSIPDSWQPEVTEKGVACESPDKVATVFFEIAKSDKDLQALIDENVDWLVKDQKVKINDATKEQKDVEISGVKWLRISWDGNHAEWGPAAVGFLFAPVGDGSALVVTYWITKKDFEKHDATLTKIFGSIKPVKK